MFRLVGVGTHRVRNDSHRKEVQAKLEEILGPYAPKGFVGFRNNFDAFAWVLTAYTGKYVDESLARECVCNKTNQGYKYTPMMDLVLGGKPWPPRPGAIPSGNASASISTPPSCIKSALEISEWREIEGELDFDEPLLDELDSDEVAC